MSFYRKYDTAYQQILKSVGAETAKNWLIGREILLGDPDDKGVTGQVK